MNRQQPQFGPGHNKAVVLLHGGCFVSPYFRKRERRFRKRSGSHLLCINSCLNPLPSAPLHVGDLAAWSLEEEVERRIFVKATFSLNKYISSWHGIHPFEVFNR
jgi:hypothetical protein